MNSSACPLKVLLKKSQHYSHRGARLMLQGFPLLQNERLNKFREHVIANKQSVRKNVASGRQNRIVERQLNLWPLSFSK